ncbi:hypothetical protein CYANOKiyG1_00220 [Okeania sp. KiyG1]|nr:hypothetical protein CYANOKiyG1_00220 [Okeania sp. KiyG1]
MGNTHPYPLPGGELKGWVGTTNRYQLLKKISLKDFGQIDWLPLQKSVIAKSDLGINKAARIVINHCLKNQIGTIVFGWNKGQKNEIKLGKK